MSYKEGSIIQYKTFSGGLRTVLVEVKDEDIKNGRPGFDGVSCDEAGKPTGDGDGVWGYDDQIVRIVKV